MHPLIWIIGGITLIPFAFWLIIRIVQPPDSMDARVINSHNSYGGYRFSVTTAGISLYIKPPFRHDFYAVTGVHSSDVRPIVKTGDFELDNTCCIHSSDPQVAGLFSPKARRIFLRYGTDYKMEIWPGSIVLTHPLPISDNSDLTYNDPENTGFSPGSGDTLLSGIIPLVEELNRPGKLGDLLRERVKTDPNPKVRVQSLRILMKTGHRGTAALIKESAQSDCFQLSIYAASQLGDNGVAVIQKWIEHKDVSKDDICYTLKAMGTEKSIHLLELALNMEHMSLFAALHLTQAGRTDLIPVLIENYQNAQRSFQIRIIAALKAIASSEVSPFLIDLCNSKDYEIAQGAVSALETCGTVEEIPALIKIMDEWSGYPRREVQKCIAEIQSRLGPVEHGWLTFAADSDLSGALSEPEAEAGGLRIVEKASDNP